MIVAGFQGQTPEGRITTLGRGGSDLTAIAMAAAIDADLCQIFTDVDGVYTCDPRVVPGAKMIDEISYDEMLEMASSGTKVMQSRSVEFAKKFGVRFEVRSSFNTNPGTLVREETMSMESVVIRGVSLERDQAKVTITGVRDQPGTASKIFGCRRRGQRDHRHDRAERVSDRHHRYLVHPQQERSRESGGRARIRCIAELGESVTMQAKGGIAKLSVVGIGMRSHAGRRRRCSRRWPTPGSISR